MITSVKNETIKQWHKLKQKKYRDQANQFLVEGAHLVQEALSSDWQVEMVIMQAGMEQAIDFPKEKMTIVSDNVMAHLTGTKSPQGIVAVVAMQQTKPSHAKKVLILDAVQDPGNLGTIIRTADAAGIDAIILGEGTVDVFNDKVVRSSQGSIFHLPIIRVDLLTYVRELQQTGFQVWASTLEKAGPIQSYPVPEKLALIVGNEGNGVSQQLLDEADQRVHIPIYGQAESLNVSVATGIMLYQIVGT